MKNNKLLKLSIVIIIATLFAMVIVLLYANSKAVEDAADTEDAGKIVQNGDASWVESKCSECGEKTICMKDSSRNVTIEAHQKTRGSDTIVKVKNQIGYEYSYHVFYQANGYDSYSEYIKKHGCSTCVLTTVIAAMSEKNSDIEPDEIIESGIKSAVGEESFDTNFDKSVKRQMPITLTGIAKVLDDYGIKYGVPTSNTENREEEITEHLKSGNPVIVTIGDGSEGGLSSYPHTILLVGIDGNGNVVIADSLKKSAAIWGNCGLFKYGKNTVADILSYIEREDGWTINKSRSEWKDRDFYKGSEDRGYMLIYPW